VNDHTTPARDRLFALIASIPGSGSVEWCGAARELLDEFTAVSAVRPPATDRTALREQIAAALGSLQGTVHHLPPATRQAVIDALVPVLPEPADRAAVLREVEQHIRELARATFQPYYRSAYATLADDISRLAAEPAAAGPDQTHTPCGPAPSQCDAEAGEPCADHEREQAHAEGEHCFCGPECDAPAVGGAQQPKEERP